jgi:hypothetical protein
MNFRRNFLCMVFAAGASAPAFGQAVMPAPTAATSASAASTPNLSGIWSHPLLPGFEPPRSGPGPVTNRSRRLEEPQKGVSNWNELVGDYTNPILQPWAAEIVKRYGQISLAGVTFPSPSNQCWPEPVPFLFKHMAMSMLQLPDRIVMMFSEDHEVRQVRMNQPHPEKVTPSWHGDAVGHYEGDTLVIDTIGAKVDRPYAMIDLFGTPYTEKLHVVERYRLRDYEDVKDVIARGAKENWRPAGPIKPGDYKDKYLQVDFTIVDEGTFTTPWTASMIYLRDRAEWPEVACAENRLGFHNDQDGGFPTANKPDF